MPERICGSVREKTLRTRHHGNHAPLGKDGITKTRDELKTEAHTEQPKLNTTWTFFEPLQFVSICWQRKLLRVWRQTWLAGNAKYDGPVLFPLILIETELQHLGMHCLRLFPALVEPIDARVTRQTSTVITKACTTTQTLTTHSAVKIYGSLKKYSLLALWRK